MELRKFTLSVITLLLCAGMCTAAQWAQVAIPISYMRSAPSHAAEQSSQAILGTPVRVLSQKGDWYNVRTPDGYTGYIRSNSIHLMTDTEYLEWLNAKKVVCTGLFEPVLPHHGYATYGTILECVSIDEDASKMNLRMPDGSEAFVSCDNNIWIPLEEWQQMCSSADADKVINIAKSMLGYPYLWGGNTSIAADCSGLTQLAYKAAGMLLPRDTSMQINCGIEVPSLEAALPGDLIFYGPNGKVNHVAIYLGENSIIHSSGCVRICRMSADAPGNYDLYTDTPLCIRRVLGVAPTQHGYAAPGVPSLFSDSIY